MKPLSIAAQTSLLTRCISLNLDLEKELKAQGLTYDDLRYRKKTIQEDLFADDSVVAEYKSLDQYRVSKHGIPAISFFSGCGGMDLGFEYAGFQNIAAVELNEGFCQTIRHNRPSSFVIGPPVYSGDARNREEIIEALRGKPAVTTNTFEGVFHGGPPCQPFSIAANQRFAKNGDNFKRTGFQNTEYGNLLFDYVFYIKTLRPTVFLIENVAGLLTVDGGDQLSEAIVQLQKAGYSVTKPAVINAADYGVPQNRLRVFIIGYKKRKTDYLFPSPSDKKVSCGAVLKLPMNGANNHITRNHKAESIIRYMDLDYGERDQLGRVDRLDPMLPAKTVIAGGSKGGGRSHLHPWIPRTLSVRESARLQTFPDDYEFVGSPARQFTQVGNAVPPLLAYRLARSIFESFFK
jgi:DNA (cytosine-5)-methyltransferase 1